MKSLVESIRETAGRLLSDGEVELIIGYERGTIPLRSTPCFIEEAGDVHKLVWDPTCDANLSKYLHDQDRRVGILAKGCDSRSVAVCIAEGQIDRENVVIIGLPCVGVIDRKKVEEHLDGREVLEARVTDEKVMVKGDGFEKALPTRAVLCDSCLACTHRNPAVFDVLVGEPVPDIPDVDEFAEVDELESRTAEERWAYFTEELGSCIRCYSCRNVCPMCYCEECFVDETMPAWFGKTTDLSDTMIYHIVRSLHLAGRCVDCGACSRACPMGINLRALTKKTEKIVKERFDFEAGISPEDVPVMGTYDQDDSEEFVI